MLESYVWFGAIMAVSAIAALRLTPDFRLRGAVILLIWPMMALLTAFAVPGFSYLFVWPALAGSFAFGWGDGGAAAWRAGRFVVVAASTLLLAVPAVDVFLQFAQPHPGNPGSQLPPAIAVSLLIGLMVVTLLAEAWTRSKSPRRDSPVAASRPHR